MAKQIRDRVDFYPLPELRQALDQWRARQPGLPSRAEAVRHILTGFLAREGFLTQPPDATPP